MLTFTSLTLTMPTRGSRILALDDRRQLIPDEIRNALFSAELTHAESGRAQSEIAGSCELASYFAGIEDLDQVAFPYVVVVTNADTAFRAIADFVHVVLEAPE